MKYKLYATSCLEELRNEEFLGEANTYQEICKLLQEKNHIAATNPYWRFIMNKNGTFIDYGSWSRFAVIVPPVPMKEMEENKND